MSQAVQEALAANAPPDLADEHDMTPLHRACKFGHTAVVKELLHTRKVDVDAVTDKGWTPVLYAAAAGSADIINMLLEHARDKRLENTFMTQRVPKGNSLDAGLDVLLLAAKYGHCEVAKVALDNGANMVTADPRGNNPLHLAIIGGTPSHLATMQLLLQRGAKWDEQNDKSYTPALLAACHTEYCRWEGGVGEDGEEKGRQLPGAVGTPE
jgi:ankyrin repeat protein